MRDCHKAALERKRKKKILKRKRHPRYDHTVQARQYFSPLGWKTRICNSLEL
jgi:hypothetical protein